MAHARERLDAAIRKVEAGRPRRVAAAPATEGDGEADDEPLSRSALDPAVEGE